VRLDALADRAHRLDPEPGAPIALGYSGGGDSTALLHVLSALSQRTGRRLHALIFDHALRPESATEAVKSAEAAERLGAEAQVLRWAAPDPRTAEARQARHRALAQAASSLGANVLHLGHTLDDRLETLLMRLGRPGGWRRLLAMPGLSPSPVWPEGQGLAIGRPLLGERRQALRQWLADRGAGWIDDPSNENRHQERIRVRDVGLSPDAEPGRTLLALGDRALRLNAAVHAMAEPVLSAAEIAPWGAIGLDVDALGRLCPPARDRAVEHAALAASGVGEIAPAARRRLEAALLSQETATAGGAMALPGGWITRDPGAAAGRADGGSGALELVLEPGEAGVFDARFEVSAGASPLVVRAFGSQAGAPSVPAAARPALAGVEIAGASTRLIGVDDAPGRFLGALSLAHLALCERGSAWFDGASTCGSSPRRTGARTAPGQYLRRQARS